MSSMGIGNKPCLDIRPSQNQINNRSVSFSQLEKGKWKRDYNDSTQFSLLWFYTESFFLIIAPKLRSSFSTSISDNTKVVQRPNSIISLGSSFSSSTSRSSGSTSSSGSHSNSNTRSAAALSVELDMINETLPLKTEHNSKKYQRSTTLASQLSMGMFMKWIQNELFYSLAIVFLTESGIIADISSSPDNEVQTNDETTGWTRSSSALLPHKTQNDNNNKCVRH